MGDVLASAGRAIDDLRIPGMLSLFFVCILLTIGVTVLALVGGYFALIALMQNLPSQQEVGTDWMYYLMVGGVYVLAASGAVVSIWLTFWSLVILVANFFDEYIAEKIEKFRYPAMAIGKSQPFWPELRHDIGFLFKIISLNLLTILLFLFIFPLLPFALLALNGYLVGQEFFTMAGGRHIGRAAAYRLAKQHRGKIFVGGLAMLIASTVPLLNLIVPFWGVAMMVHLYHRLAQPVPQTALPTTLPPTA